MIRYIGNSSASKKKKNSSRSRARNDPIMAVSRNRKASMKYFTWFSIRHEISTPAGIRNVVSRTKNRLMPSTPRKNSK